MQTVAILQNADFSPHLQTLSLGISRMEFDSRSTSVNDTSFTKNGDGKESFESMIQRASLEKNTQEEKMGTEKVPDRPNENLAGEKVAEQKAGSEFPSKNADEMLSKNENVSKDAKGADLKAVKKGRFSKSNVLEKKDGTQNPRHIESVGGNEFSAFENFVEKHSLTKDVANSRVSKNQVDFDKEDSGSEHDLLEKITVPDDEYAILAAENASNFANFLSKEEILSNGNFSNLENLPSTDDLSLETILGVEERTGNGNKLYLDADKKILVSDYRTETPLENTKDADTKTTSLRFGEVAVTSENTAQITVDLASAEMSKANILSTNNQFASANGSHFQAMLTNQIQQNASEFVKAGNIVLRDNDYGQIKLVLHPENLGNVKIDLQIADKNITGRILVASSQAYNAFKESVESLRTAFISSGFESASFDLNYSGQNFGNGDGGQNRSQDQNAFLAVSRTYGEYSSSMDFDTFDDGNFNEISSKNAINIVA